MEGLHTPTVYVVATTTEGTEAALAAAASLAATLKTEEEEEARIVLVLPQNGGDRGPSTPHSASATWLVSHYEVVARRLAQTVQIRCCESDETAEAVRRMTPRHATIVIGGPALWWWPSVEERLAARLRRSGREVVFVGCNGRPLKSFSGRHQ